jgi:alpha/beta superfamily hydrolase
VTRSSAPSRLVRVRVPGPAGALEGLLQVRGEEPHPIVAVVCHPHPLYGGTMHNKVAHRMASTLQELGAAVLRFNFRGAGGSEGRFDQGRGELEDARAALGFAAARFPAARRWVAGFSFGGWIAARLAAADPAVERLIMVAPAVGRFPFDVLRAARLPKLALQGTRDDVCPLEALEVAFMEWADPKQLIRVEGASHFFDRQLGALAKAMVQALSGPATAATSSNT